VLAWAIKEVLCYSGSRNICGIVVNSLIVYNSKGEGEEGGREHKSSERNKGAGGRDHKTKAKTVLPRPRQQGKKDKAKAKKNGRSSSQRKKRRTKNNGLVRVLEAKTVHQNPLTHETAKKRGREKLIPTTRAAI
jgi:hypothetical protein